MTSNQIKLYWNTARHLKPTQIWHRVWRPSPGPYLQFSDALPRVVGGTLASSIQRENPWLGGKRWRHLNQERTIDTWNDAGIDKLWLYHLHYLERPNPEIVSAWIKENPPGAGNGWEPYPISRRVSNWIFWLLEDSLEHEIRRNAERSLAHQVEWLSHRVEWHLLGNHLWANAKALIMGGVYFDCSAADCWLKEGIEIFQRELREQVLEDGGHFELSPMYHALALEDLLDLVNLAGIYPQPLKNEEGEWRATAGKMLGWLAQMTHPDGQLAYFNDAVQGIAPTLAQLQAYAEALGVKEERVRLGASGYARIESGDTTVILDAGPIGPDYQPGHGHCDMLSIEASHKGQQVIANSGISTYEKGEQRLAERRTAAHNTVRVDNAEQSELWGSFRVGRRARVIEANTENGNCAEGAHDGYKGLKGHVVHRRRVDVANGKVTVSDQLEGTGEHTAEIFWHPAVNADVQVEFEAPLVRREETGWWCEGFNKKVDRPVVVGVWSGALPVELKSDLNFT